MGVASGVPVAAGADAAATVGVGAGTRRRGRSPCRPPRAARPGRRAAVRAEES
ncbi:hypothetical protein V2I01_00140 [Micromonospora sp. BRA006-A]|nr:hypothetical protein [Micromonospora sp. BRA006-A]